jgi:hypothetical protein
MQVDVPSLQLLSHQSREDSDKGTSDLSGLAACGCSLNQNIHEDQIQDDLLENVGENPTIRFVLLTFEVLRSYAGQHRPSAFAQCRA